MRATMSRGLPRLLTLLVVLAAAPPPAARAEGSWIPVGPNDVAMIMAIAGGRTSVYAATCNGVYRSDDGAASWHETGLQRLNVVRLAVDSSGDADTLYAIVDNRDFVSPFPEPSAFVFPGIILGSTLWVSKDGGQTWDDRELASGNALAVDASQPGTAYVANANSIYAPLAVSHDFGTTWRPVPGAPGEVSIGSGLAVDPRNGTLYLASGGSLSVLSAGAWSNVAIPATIVAAGSGSDGAVYAAGDTTFCRKTTNEASWSCLAIPQDAPLDILEIPAQPGGQGARVLLFRTRGLQSSDDGGATFSSVANGPPGYAPVAALDPTGAAVYAGNDIGVYRSADRGETWTNSSAGLSSTWVRALAFDPQHASTILAGAEARIRDVYQVGPGLFRSNDGGDSWTSASDAGEPGYVFSLGIDPSNSRNLFTASFQRVDRSGDGGATWAQSGTAAFSQSGFVHALAVDPSDSTKVWATGSSLMASDDGGQTWSSALPDTVFSLLFDPRHPGTIYAGEFWEDQGSYYPYGSGFAVQTSRDDGRTWTRTGSALEGAGVTAFAADPFSDVVYASTYAGTVVQSSDSGASWQDVGAQGANLGSPIFALIADPIRRGVLYLSGWGGVSRSVDGGKTWDLFVDGLEPYGVLGLAISPDGRSLYAGTTGGGVYRRDLVLSSRAPLTPIGRTGGRTTREVTRP